MTFRVEEFGLKGLQADLSQAALEAPFKVRQALQVTAQHIRDDARAFASGISHAPLYPRSITYETTVTPVGVEAEIGPDKKLPQGALGNILESSP